MYIITDEEWQEAQVCEAGYWSSGANMFLEQQKQISYACLMGLDQFKSGHCFDLNGMSVLDIGGGPASILLRCANFSRGVVLDPCGYQNWVRQRYEESGIEFVNKQAETYDPDQQFDEAWIYNVLQHVQDPAAVVELAKKAAQRVRIFDWLETAVSEIHPHTFSKQDIDGLFGAVGQVTHYEDGQSALAYSGVFYYGYGVLHGQKSEGAEAQVAIRCSRCGYPNPFGSRFCGQCGQRLIQR